MSDLPYELHEETKNEAGNRDWNGFTRNEVIAHAIAKEIALGRLMPIHVTHFTAQPMDAEPAKWTEAPSAPLPPVSSDTTYVAGVSEPLSDLDVSVGEPPKPEQPKPTIWPKRRHR